MAFYVVAMEREEFDAWYARQSAPAPDPTAALPARGKALFLENGCGACHAIRGTAAKGGSARISRMSEARVSLAAGTFPNNLGTLAGWIARPSTSSPAT